MRVWIDIIASASQISSSTNGSLQEAATLNKFWIDADGQRLNIAHDGHHADEVDERWDDVFGAGWARCSKFGHEYNIQYDPENITRRAISTLLRTIASPLDYVNVDTPRDHDNTYSRQGFAEKMRSLLALRIIPSTSTIEPVTEGWHASLPTGTGYYDVFRNPTKTEAMRIIADDEYGQARAWITPADLFVFTANQTHMGPEVDMSDEINRFDHGRIFIDRNGPYTNECDEMGECFRRDEAKETIDFNEIDKSVYEDYLKTRALATAHPSLQRIYGRDYILGCR